VLAAATGAADATGPAGRDEMTQVAAPTAAAVARGRGLELGRRAARRRGRRLPLPGVRQLLGHHADLQHEFAALSTEWLRGGPALALPPREQAKLSLHTDTRRTSLAGLDAAE